MSAMSKQSAVGGPASVTFLADHAGGDLASFDGNRLIDHTPQLRVVSHLDVAGDREITAEGVPDKAIVGKDAAQVRMALEQDAIQVEGLPLVPTGRRPNRKQG